jgi:hypothetical protein
MATESSIISTWLQTILTADSGVGGVATLAPGGIHEVRDSSGNGTYPKVIHRRQGGGYVQTVNGIIVALQGVYAVYGVWQTPDYGGALESIAARIRTLLHLKQATVSGGLILASVAIEPIELATLENGVEIRMLGELLRIHGQAT